MMRVIAGDIGGTKTRLALAEVEGVRLRPEGGGAGIPGAGVAASHHVPPRGKVRIEIETEYPSCDFPTFDALLADFLKDKDTPGRAAFGIAGPVLNRIGSATNLPWCVEADALQQRFGFGDCILLNDLEATACGIPALGPDDLLELRPGAEGACGNAAVIAAGTGLGEAGLYWDGVRHHPYASEGGHASFSPQDELEIAFLRHLQLRHPHVSWERVVSGMGLCSLHEFMRIYRDQPAPQWLAQELRKGDAAAVISKAALDGSDAICVETLQRFVRLYGAEAGNLALKTMSRGGMYVGGGIAPRILPLMKGATFTDAFLGKGRMRALLETMPLRVILNDRAALYGAALIAAAGDNNS